MAQKFRENIPFAKGVTMPRTANEPVCAARKAAAEGAALAEKWIAKRCAEPFGTDHVSSCKNYPMSVISAQTAESARWTESTTWRSRQMQWQSGGTRRPEASRNCEEKK